MVCELFQMKGDKIHNLMPPMQCTPQTIEDGNMENCLEFMGSSVVNDQAFDILLLLRLTYYNIGITNI